MLYKPYNKLTRLTLVDGVHRSSRSLIEVLLAKASKNNALLRQGFEEIFILVYFLSELLE
jgi:hypothetical protein